MGDKKEDVLTKMSGEGNLSLSGKWWGLFHASAKKKPLIL